MKPRVRRRRGRLSQLSSLEFRLFKIVERGGDGDREPTKIVKPTERTSAGESKVVLLTDSLNTSTVAEAILVDKDSSFLAKRDISKFIRNNQISDRLDSFNLGDEAVGEFVYDVYRLDLGRFTAKDIEGRGAHCLQIVTYEQEFLNEESDDSESDIFEDEDDSNGNKTHTNKHESIYLNVPVAEDFYANDYPDEESYISENDDEGNFTDGEIIDDDDNAGEFIFNESFEIEAGATDDDSDFIIDLDSDDYNCEDDDSDYDEDDDENVKYCYDDGSEEDGCYDEDM